MMKMSDRRFDFNHHHQNHHSWSWTWWSFLIGGGGGGNQNLFVKFTVSVLVVVGLVSHLFFFSNNHDSVGVSYNLTTTTTTTTATTQEDNLLLPTTTTTQGMLSTTNKDDHQITHKEKCDIFSGNWIHDPLGPVYNNETCLNIEDHQNCMKNGRPDTGYLYWRWRPRDCELERFNGDRFLKLMKNKSWAFIGDSISRNQVQSLLCILSKVVPAIEVYHDKEHKSKRWHFPSYNFTLSMIWSPFLLKAATFEDRNGVATSHVKLHLDELDKKWTDQYRKFDYVVLSGGKWFLKSSIYYEKNKIVGCHNCQGMNVTEYGFENVYHKALSLVLNFIKNSDHKSIVILRTVTPDHFENGEWFSGGTCDRTIPFKNGEYSLKNIDLMMRKIEFEEFRKAASTVGTQERVKLQLLDTTRLSSLRPDGHPGAYRQFSSLSKDRNTKVPNDCLHWCLPGPIDSWNDLLMDMVLNG